MTMKTTMVTACVMAAASAASAAPVLRSADVRITFTSPTSCDVTMALTIDGAPEIDHRLDASPSGVELIDSRGAQRIGDVRAVGRTQSLVLRPNHAAYEFAYRARQPDDRAYRCPIWLPAVATDGQSRAVRLQIDLPSGSAHGASMPALTWTGVHGSTTIGHLPAFVRVSYGPEGESPGWSVGQVMDAAAATVFAGASALWVWRRRR
jgi:hypothetical protein